MNQLHRGLKSASCPTCFGFEPQAGGQTNSNKPFHKKVVTL